jgi:hypothetical protein
VQNPKVVPVVVPLLATTVDPAPALPPEGMSLGRAMGACTPTSPRSALGLGDTVGLTVVVSLEVGDCVRSAEDVGEGEGDGDDGGSLASMDVPLILSANLYLK